MRIKNHRTLQWVLYATALLVLLLSMIALVIWFDTRPTQSLSTVHTTTPQGVHSVRIMRPNRPDMVLSRTDDRWFMSQPCELAVSDSRLEPLLSLVNASVHSYAAAEVDLEAAGLTSPQAVVVFNDTQPVAIGNTDLGGERRYIQRMDRVEFVPEWVLPLIDGGVTAFAELALFPETLEAVTLTPHDDSKNPYNEVVADWQSMTADQIATFPLPESATLLDTWTLNTHSANMQRRLTLQRYDAFTAILTDNGQCAFLVAANAMPGH